VALSAAELDALNRARVVACILPAALHDARNALQGISGTAELIAISRATDPTQVQARVQSVLHQAAWMGTRLEQLGQVNAPPPGGTEPIDLRQLCLRVVDFRTASWGRRRITATVEVPPGLMVAAVPRNAERILLNLLINAEAGLVAAGGTVTLAATVTDGAVSLTVADSGRGVDADDVPFLFTAQGANQRLTTGLVVSRALAESMGGTLTWRGPSAPSTFECRLPAL
jgi:signal transduction histidine kinase